MAVSIWELHWVGRGISQSDNSITATRGFLVTTDDKNDSEHDVLTDTNAPNIGDAYPDNGFLRVESVSAEQDPETPLLWTVTVQYSSSVPEDKDLVFEDPLARPPEVSVTQVRGSETVEVLEDFFNRFPGFTHILLLNSAQTRYDPPLERERLDIGITVSQNFADFRPNDILGFRGAVNGDKWEGFDEGQARIINISFRKLTANGVTFWQRTIEIHVRDKSADYSFNTIYPWQTLVPNTGFQQLNALGTGLIDCINDEGEQVSEPAKLDANGKQVAANATGSFERWDLYPVKNFADLDIRLT